MGTCLLCGKPANRIEFVEKRIKYGRAFRAIHDYKNKFGNNVIHTVEYDSTEHLGTPKRALMKGFREKIFLTFSGDSEFSR